MAAGRNRPRLHDPDAVLFSNQPCMVCAAVAAVPVEVQLKKDSEPEHAASEHAHVRLPVQLGSVHCAAW